MGTYKEPGRCASMETEEWLGQWYRAGCARSVKASRALHADHGPRVAVRPCLRKDFTALLRASGSVRRRVCPGVVQADAPRHGPDRALSRPAGSEGAAAVARPDPRGESSADRRAGDCCFEGEDPRVRLVRSPVGLDGLGVGVNLPGLG